MSRSTWNNPEDLFDILYKRLPEDVYDMWRQANHASEAIYNENLSEMARDLGMPQSSLYRTLRPNGDVKSGTLRSRLVKLAEALDKRGRAPFKAIVEGSDAPWDDEDYRPPKDLGPPPSKSVSERRTRYRAAEPVQLVDQIERLARLHTESMLSKEEFAAAKAKLLGIQP